MNESKYLEPYEIAVWDVYFTGITSMAHCHPGAGRSNGHAEAPPKLSIRECAALALEMVEVRREVVGSS